MTIRSLLLPALAAAACLLPGTAAAQGVGSHLPREVALGGFTGVPVESFDELAGRTLLLEFFAYW